MAGIRWPSGLHLQASSEDLGQDLVITSSLCPLSPTVHESQQRQPGPFGESKLALPPWAGYFALLGVVFLAYFRHFGSLGLYGDDAAFFGGLINRNWQSELENTLFSFRYWPQGRPLGMGFNLSLLPFIVFKIGGLAGLHLFAFVVVSLNSLLLFRLLRDRCSPLLAFSAAGFYALAPADTVQNSLVYAYNFELAALCGLVAVSAAIRRQTVVFSLALAAGLLMVEPVVMWVLFIPLFVDGSASQPWRRWLLRHILNWTAVVGAVLVIRRAIGDPSGAERVAELSSQPLAAVQRGLESAVTGSKTHLFMTAERLALPWREADVGLGLLMAACGILIVFGLIVLVTPRLKSPPDSSELSRFSDRGAAVRLILAGSVTMAATYFCYFRVPWHPANWQTGFMSGVHVLAGIGSSLVFAGLVGLLGSALPLRFKRLALVVPVAVLTSLAGFGELVQRDYVRAWTFQRNFWQAYVRLCPDATDRTFVLALDRNLPPARFIERFSWCSEVLPAALFQYRTLSLPATSDTAKPLTRPPVVMVTAPDLVQAIRQEGPRYVWKATYYFMLPKGPDQQPEANNLIVLSLDAQGQWHRLEGNVPVDGGTIGLRPSGGDNVLQQVRPTALARVYGL